MSVKITINVCKGSTAGESFTYDSKESLIVGRQKDCAIILPEITVSRYHCLIDIAPPTVMVRDFNSLNGTYLNGEKIGQREKGVSAEVARQNQGEAFALKPGDRLGVGKDCELEVEVTLPQYCADCFGEIEGVEYRNLEKMAICEECHAKLEEEENAREAAAKAKKEQAEARKKAKEAAAKEKAAADAKAKAEAEKARLAAEKKAAELERKKQEEERRQKALEDKRKAEKALKEAEQKRRNNRNCEVCGRPLANSGDEPDICFTCREDPLKVLKFLMEQALKGQGDAVQIAGYRNIKMLGKGGMGQVWQVEEEKTGEQMALKIMLPQARVDERSKALFLREAYVAGQLSHKNVVRHYKCGQSGETYFILMELCDGGSVDRLIERNGGKLALDQAVNITRQVLDGFIYAHKAPLFVQLKSGEQVKANGIVHRDFKPGNIFISGSGSKLTAKIADFGLAKAFETSGLSGHTESGQVAGTPVFMPRQQIINYRYAEPDVDVWAVAASLYYMLTGTFPKDFNNAKDVIAAALTNEAVPIRKRNPGVPKKLADVLDTALREKPGIGVKSAAELKKLIDGAI